MFSGNFSKPVANEVKRILDITKKEEFEPKYLGVFVLDGKMVKRGLKPSKLVRARGW